MNTETIIAGLKSVANPARKAASKTMFPTSMEYLGVRNPEMKKLVKTWWIEIKEWPPEQLIHFAKELTETRIFECNQVAFELLWMNKKALSQLTLADLEFLGQNMDNWATTDTFSVYLSGWAWRNKQIADSNILKWLTSENLWWRRAAIVSTVGMNLKSRGGTGDTPRTLMICEKAVDDRRDMIVKALSWALRELSKHDRKSVEQFMEKHETYLANRVRREVYTKIKTGTKSGKVKK